MYIFPPANYSGCDKKIEPAWLKTFRPAIECWCTWPQLAEQFREGCPALELALLTSKFENNWQELPCEAPKKHITMLLEKQKQHTSPARSSPPWKCSNHVRNSGPECDRLWPPLNMHIKLSAMLTRLSDDKDSLSSCKSLLLRNVTSSLSHKTRTKQVTILPNNQTHYPK